MRRLLTDSPFAVSAVSKLMFGFACSSSTSFAITTPFALRHGPFPIRSRAFTAACPPSPLALRYARHVFPPAFASFASDWQRASAPVSPPRPAPSPPRLPALAAGPESPPPRLSTRVRLLRERLAACVGSRQPAQVTAFSGIGREKERHGGVLRLRRTANGQSRNAHCAKELAIHGWLSSIGLETPGEHRKARN